MRPSWTIAALMLLLGCGSDSDDGALPISSGGGGDDDEEVEAAQLCPTGMVFISAAAPTLGEWDEVTLEAFEGEVIPLISLDLASFCIDAYAFPNVEGVDWPYSGMYWEQAELMNTRLALFNRRLCTVSELMYAAGGGDNWRYPYDQTDYIKGVCETNDEFPSPIGAFADCVSPNGVHDFMVRSTWATLGTDMADHMDRYLEQGFPGDGSLAVWGGTSRRDTFYAPSNFGLHFHEPGAEVYLDDGLRVCAEIGEPDAVVEADYAEWVAVFLETGTFNVLVGTP